MACGKAWQGVRRGQHPMHAVVENESGENVFVFTIFVVAPSSPQTPSLCVVIEYAVCVCVLLSCVNVFVCVASGGWLLFGSVVGRLQSIKRPPVCASSVYVFDCVGFSFLRNGSPSGVVELLPRGAGRILARACVGRACCVRCNSKGCRWRCDGLPCGLRARL